MEDWKKVLYSTDFMLKLMDEQQWSKEYTIRVITEYLAFLLLAAVEDVAPSYEVDQVWHMHMLYSENYTSICKVLIGKYLHHNPTSSKEKSTRTVDPYKHTLQLYKEVFRRDAPKDIWTDWKPRQDVRVNLKENWVVPVGDWKMLIKLLFKQIWG